MHAEDKVLVQRLKNHFTQITDLLGAGGAPGLSLGVFHHGEIIYTQHFGRRDVDHPKQPDDDTIYFVASTFKVVTACVLARLVTDDLLGWDVPICEYLLTFSQRKDQVGLEVTVRDLIANCSGLPMAHFYWGQQNGEDLMPKEELERFACHITSVKPLRSQFIYSQWNFILIQILVETITAKSFGDFVREAIFEPLGLKTATFDDPVGTNRMKPHAVRDDGRACKIRLTTFSSATGLAAGTGAKSSIKDQLKLYINLLHAYNHQISENIDSTPGSPFTQLRTIFAPHIELPGTKIEQQAYCLGLYRTQLPGNLSYASTNASLPRDRLPIFGQVETEKALPTEYIWHHSATTPGFTGAMFLVPETHSGVVVHTNATSRLDAADFIAQLLLSTLLDVTPAQDLTNLSRIAVQMQLGWFKKLSNLVESRKTSKPPTHPLQAYSGTYWNSTRDFKIVITAQSNVLRASIQGLPITHYNLQPCDGDTFYWPVNREFELVELGTLFQIWPQYHFVRFATNERRVLDLTWQHYRLMKPEIFEKEVDHLEGRL